MFISNNSISIEKEKWIEIVNSSHYLVSIQEYENSKIESYGYAIFRLEGFVYGILSWDWEKQKIDIEIKIKYLSKIYQSLENIASDLGGIFYFKKNEPFDPLKHLPIPAIKIERSQQYFENHDLDEIRWLAIRENEDTSLFKTLKLEKEKEGNLKELLGNDNLVVTPTYEGWKFIIGDNLPSLLIKGDESSTEEALSNLCKSIQKLSKSLVEVQYFEYSEKSSVTGYFKANNGKLIFGYWKSELEEFKKGKLPKDIKKLHPSTAHEVSSIWSIDPMDFVFIEKFAKEKSISAVLL